MAYRVSRARSAIAVACALLGVMTVLASGSLAVHLVRHAHAPSETDLAATATTVRLRKDHPSLQIDQVKPFDRSYGEAFEPAWLAITTPVSTVMLVGDPLRMVVVLPERASATADRLLTQAHRLDRLHPPPAPDDEATDTALLQQVPLISGMGAQLRQLPHNVGLFLTYPTVETDRHGHTKAANAQDGTTPSNDRGVWWLTVPEPMWDAALKAMADHPLSSVERPFPTLTPSRNP